MQPTQINENYKFQFEKLEIWQLVIEYSVFIYVMTKKFPKEEIYSTVDQLKRAATSIGTNMAEGSARKGKKDKARFFEIAFGSLMETMSLSITSRKLNFIDDSDLNVVRQKVLELSNKINSYYNKLLE